MKNNIEFYFKKAIRQGNCFKKILKQLEKSQFYSKEEMLFFQNRKLQEIINHCYKNVPYYKDLFRELKLAPDDIKTRQDLVKLPFLDKHTVKENFDKFIAKNKSRLLCNTGYTSGSSGTPGKFLRDYYSINFENAAIWRLWKNTGDTGLKRVTLRGDIITPVDKNDPPFWKYNPADQELLMSSYHMSDSNAHIYIEKIKEFNPEILYAYPSTAYILANFFKNLNQNFEFKAVFTSSESLSHGQKEFIEKTFNCKVFDWYGQAERVAAIGHCEKGTYHIIEDYSIVELIETTSGYEPVGTHLHNYLMPLLRYKTEDVVKLGTKNCSCGLHFREIEEIQGRSVDYILTPEKTRITICNHIPRGVENVVETQFVQEKIGEVIINITTNGRFSETDKSQLIKNTIEHTSPNMKVIVNQVNEIQKGPNGKFVSIINKLTKEISQKERSYER